MVTPPGPVIEIEPLVEPLCRRQSWAGDPAPIPGELMSSWLARLAAATKIPVQALLDVLRRQIGRLGDVDCDRAPRLVALLSEQTGHPKSTLALLQRFAHPVGQGLAAHVGGARFCPICWEDDATPYLRWEWRFSLVRACPVHDVQLVSVCPQCRATFDVLQAGRGPITRCRPCGADLLRAVRRKAKSSFLRGQRVLLDLLAVAEDVDRPEWGAYLIYQSRSRCARNLGREPTDREWLVALGEAANNRDPAIGRVLPTDFPSGPMIDVACSSSRSVWPQRGPLPVRCWQTDVWNGPVYADDRPAISIKWDVDLYELLQAYVQVRQRLARAPGSSESPPVTLMGLHPSSQDLYSAGEVLGQLYSVLKDSRDWVQLRDCLPEGGGTLKARSALAAHFVASLELCRQQKAELRQDDGIFAPIWLRGRSADP